MGHQVDDETEELLSAVQHSRETVPDGLCCVCSGQELRWAPGLSVLQTFHAIHCPLHSCDCLLAGCGHQAAPNAALGARLTLLVVDCTGSGPRYRKLWMSIPCKANMPPVSFMSSHVVTEGFARMDEISGLKI